MEALSGVTPTFDLSWEEITGGAGLPQSLDGEPGLYGIYAGDALVYVGSSRSLGRRIGQAVAAICGAPGLHPGGRRIFFEWDNLQKPLRFVVFVGEDARSRERDAIILMRPKMNVIYNRDGRNIPDLDFVD